MIAPTLPPLGVYRLWVRAGHGRAVLVTNPDIPQEYKDEILRWAVIGHDVEFETRSGFYFVELATRAGIRDELREAIFAAGLDEDKCGFWEPFERCDILAALALSGDQKALECLKEGDSAGHEAAHLSYFICLRQLAQDGNHDAFGELTQRAARKDKRALGALLGSGAKGFKWVADHGLDLINERNLDELRDALRDMPADVAAEDIARVQAKVQSVEIEHGRLNALYDAYTYSSFPTQSSENAQPTIVERVQPAGDGEAKAAKSSRERAKQPRRPDNLDAILAGATAQLLAASENGADYFGICSEMKSLASKLPPEESLRVLNWVLENAISLDHRYMAMLDLLSRQDADFSASVEEMCHDALVVVRDYGLKLNGGSI